MKSRETVFFFITRLCAESIEKISLCLVEAAEETTREKKKAKCVLVPEVKRSRVKAEEKWMLLLAVDKRVEEDERLFLKKNI